MRKLESTTVSTRPISNHHFGPGMFMATLEHSLVSLLRCQMGVPSLIESVGSQAVDVVRLPGLGDWSLCRAAEVASARLSAARQAREVAAAGGQRFPVPPECRVGFALEAGQHLCVRLRSRA